MRTLPRRLAACVVAALTALFVLTAAPSTQAAPHLHGSVAERIDQYLTTQLESSAIPGFAVAVTRGNRVLMTRGYGHDSAGKSVAEDSLFRIASLSKSFTALAVMQLVDHGLLSLGDPVQQHLPEFRMADPRAGQVTVRQLLDHTSGITDAVVPELSRRQPTTPSEAATSLRSAHLATAPGTTYSYANPNYQVAARLVEVVSGEPFSSYLERHVLAPSGMVSTTSTATDTGPVAGLVDGHLLAYGRAFKVSSFGSFATGDGGIVSSAADMARWLVVHSSRGRTLNGARLVSGRGMRMLHTPSAPGSGYALGWDTSGPSGAPTRLEHSGSLFTFTSWQALWPESRYGVALLFNSGSPMMMDQTAIAHGVFDIIEGRTPPASGPQLATRIDLVLGALTLAVLALGASGLVRARRWATRRRGALWRALLGLLPSVVVLLVGAVFPRLVELWIGRDVTWRAAAFEWPALVVFVGALVVAASATLLARLWQWRRTGGLGAATPTSLPEGRLGSPHETSRARTPHPAASSL